MKDNIEVICPYCIGIINSKDSNLKKYINGLMDALYESNPIIAMEKIYDKAKAIPQPQDLRFTQDWPYQDKQSDYTDNCITSSHNFGVMCRQGTTFADWLCNQENSLIWQNVNTSKPNISQIPTIHKSISSTRSLETSISYESNQNQAILSESARANTLINFVSQPVNVANLPTYQQLMQKLARCLNVASNDVDRETIIGQTLVALALKSYLPCINVEYNKVYSKVIIEQMSVALVLGNYLQDKSVTSNNQNIQQQKECSVQ
jgi:hypothetical protein